MGPSFAQCESRRWALAIWMISWIERTNSRKCLLVDFPASCY